MPTDAERMDWLEKNPHANICRHPNLEKWYVYSFLDQKSFTGPTLRSAIDASMAREEGQ